MEGTDHSKFQPCTTRDNHILWEVPCRTICYAQLLTEASTNVWHRKERYGCVWNTMEGTNHSKFQPCTTGDNHMLWEVPCRTICYAQLMIEASTNMWHNRERYGCVWNTMEGAGHSKFQPYTTRDNRKLWEVHVVPYAMLKYWQSLPPMCDTEERDLDGSETPWKAPTTQNFSHAQHEITHTWRNFLHDIGKNKSCLP